MLFKLDENLPDALVAILVAAGHDVHTVAAEGLGGAKDPQVLAACLREKRALITFDLDFADIRSYPPTSFHGLVVLRLRTQAASHVISVLTRVLSLFRAEPLDGHLWLVEDAQVRIR